MAFRRQDIPKTTRNGKDGAPRRLFPKFIRDQTILPKITLVIDYLDGMIGRKRGDLSPDVVLDLFGDPKLARCMLSCLAESYRYRSLDFSEVIGPDAALALAGWDLMTPADLRGHVYRIANASGDGFVIAAGRATFLDDTAAPLGLSGEQLDALLNLDAEQHQILVRIGPKPTASDVVARYNVVLLTSILRSAASIDLCTPGLDHAIVETVLTRFGVEGRRSGKDSIRLVGRRNALGGWSSFGHRLARAAIQLVALSTHAPDFHAVVHLGDQRSELTLDSKGLMCLRPTQRSVADASGIVLARMLDEDVVTLRRRRGDELAGWAVRRLPEPVVVADAMLLPELAFVLGQLVVPIITIPIDEGRSAALRAATTVGMQRPVVALGISVTSEGVYVLPRPEAAALITLLDAISSDYDLEATPQKVLWSELVVTGWVATSRVSELFPSSNLPIDIQGGWDDGIATLVPGFGLSSVGFLEDMSDRVLAGPADIATVRARIASEIGDGSAADALTLHLLGQQQRAALAPHLSQPEPAVAA